jgi:hypothetical protein
MRSFWWEVFGERIEIVFKLINSNSGQWQRNSEDPNMRILTFDYPPAEELLGDTQIRIADFELEEMDAEVRSMLFQTLKIDAPEFGCSYS